MAPPFTFVSLPLVPLNRELREFILPHVTNGRSDVGSYRTTLSLLNASERQNRITVSVQGDDGSSSSLGIPGLTPDGGSATFEFAGAQTGLTLETDGKGPLRTGAVLITSTEPLGIGAIVSSFDSGGLPLADTAMYDVEGLSDAVVPVEADPDAQVQLSRDQNPFRNGQK